MKIKTQAAIETEIETPHFRKRDDGKRIVEILETGYREVLFLGKMPSISEYDSHILIDEYFKNDWKECFREDFENAIDRACDKWLHFMSTRKKFEPAI